MSHNTPSIGGAVLGDRPDIQEALRNQPPWSDFPLVVLAREGAGDRVTRFASR